MTKKNIAGTKRVGRRRGYNKSTVTKATTKGKKQSTSLGLFGKKTPKLWD